MNKFCTNCGKELGGAKFCPNCGAPAEPAKSKQNASIIGGGVKTNKGNVVTMGFLIAYLVLMLFSCIDFSAPILDNIYSIKFYEIPMLIFKWSRYIYSNDVKTVFILVCIVASIAEICMAVISIRGLIKVFTTDESAVSSMHGASSGAITLSAVVMVSTFIIKAMLNSAPGGNYLNYGNVVSLSGATIFLLILGIIGAVVATKLEDSEGSYQNPNTQRSYFDSRSSRNTISAGSNNDWICPNCFKKHAHYVTTCTCGTPKSSANDPNLLKKVEMVENGWICPKCGKVNQNYIGTCGCGFSK